MTHNLLSRTGCAAHNHLTGAPPNDTAQGVVSMKLKKPGSMPAHGAATSVLLRADWHLRPAPIPHVPCYPIPADDETSPLNWSFLFCITISSGYFPTVMSKTGRDAVLYLYLTESALSELWVIGRNQARASGLSPSGLSENAPSNRRV